MSTTTSGLRERRSFLSRLAAGAAVVGGTVFASRPVAAQSTSAAPWRPARHAQDDWLDQIPGSHRFIIDSTSPLGLGNGMLFANNFFVGNQNGYGLGNAALRAAGSDVPSAEAVRAGRSGTSSASSC